MFNIVGKARAAQGGSPFSEDWSLQFLGITYELIWNADSLGLYHLSSCGGGAGKSGSRQILQLITEHSNVLEPPTDIQSPNAFSRGFAHSWAELKPYYLPIEFFCISLFVLLVFLPYFVILLFKTSFFYLYLYGYFSCVSTAHVCLVPLDARKRRQIL